jgi:hypothetical protein
MEKDSSHEIICATILEFTLWDYRKRLKTQLRQPVPQLRFESVTSTIPVRNITF